MPQLRRQAAKWRLYPPPPPLPDIGLKTWWSVCLAVVLGAGFAMSVFVKGYTYLDNLISPPPPSPSVQIDQFKSDLTKGRQTLDILTKGMDEASERLEKMQAEINDPHATSKPTEEDLAEAKKDVEEKAQAKESVQRAIAEKKAKLDVLEHLPVMGTTSPN
jgi:hypothetical protein